MGIYNEKLERYKKEWREIWDSLPDSERFGNVRLLKLQTNIDNITADLDKNHECEDCNGWGVVECCECGHERDCTTCESTGLIPKLV